MIFAVVFFERPLEGDVMKFVSRRLIENVVHPCRIHSDHAVVFADDVEAESVDRSDIRIRKQDELFSDILFFLFVFGGLRKILKTLCDPVLHFCGGGFGEGHRENFIQ